MREQFQMILSDYLDASKQKYNNHPIAFVIRHNIPNEISRIIADRERYLIKGSSGAGNWAAIPWIGIFDILITQSAQSGYYPVFLFRDDMQGFYLSLNQGVTEIKEKYNRESKQVLKLKAEDYRAQIGELPTNFNETKINLKGLNKTSDNLSKLYEAGNILAKYYPANNLPAENIFQTDIHDILKIYELLAYNEGLPTVKGEIESDEEKYKGFEELKKIRLHKRIERNSKLSKKAKEFHGYTCKACNMNFVSKYGNLGEDFIEAHHLTPISKLSGTKIQLDIRKDFTVLCSNCHSMIHRLNDPSNLDLLISILANNSR